MNIQGWLVSLTCCLVCVVSWGSTAAGLAADADSAIQFRRDDDQGQLWVDVCGKPAFCYRYGESVDLPHFFPINSPDGQSMTVQQTQPYPHHRSFWFGDRVSLAGQRPVATYSALYTGVKQADGSYTGPFKDGVRHVRLKELSCQGEVGRINLQLLWHMDHDTPLLDEDREIRIRSLGDGQYFVDVVFTVTANYGDVSFCSDDVHYAWPYVRLNPEFAVPGGARMVADTGPITVARSTKVVANWVDYSNTAEGKNCGLAMFSHDDNAKPHRWLTRDYGTFGPRRPDVKSGKPFILKQGESMVRRIGILVHRGDVTTGHVAERYSDYVQGKL